VKITDEPDAKIKLWARNPRVVRTPRIANLPRFGVRRFNSYADFNKWKQDLLLELVRQGGAKWTR
jgi:hypothetical protein